jgi:Ni/Fe-hydrogenase subunit HybB-like protein
MRILDDFSRIIAPMLIIFALFRFADLSKQRALGYLFLPVAETAYFWLEMVLFVAAPVVLFNLPRVRQKPIGLYWASAVTIAGFMVQRINVSINSLEGATHAGYVPKWPELAVTLMLASAAVLAFRFAVLHLEILPRAAQVSPPTFQLPRTTGHVFPAQPSAAVN